MALMARRRNVGLNDFVCLAVDGALFVEHTTNVTLWRIWLAGEPSTKETAQASQLTQSTSAAMIQ
jgi:hypothetical protein